MTKAILTIDESSNIMFDCSNHAGDHDACTIMATLCNVLVCSAFRNGKEPTVYNPGHVRIDIMNADEKTIETFRCVYEAMEQAAKQQPEFIKTY